MSRIVNESVNECILYENRKNKVLRTTIDRANTVSTFYGKITATIYQYVIQYNHLQTAPRGVLTQENYRVI